MKHIPLKAGTLSKQSVLNDYNEQMKDNFTEAGSSVVICELDTDLQINANNTIIDGSTFTPQITREPSFTRVYQNTEDGMMIQDIVIGYVANGNYFDVIVGEITEIMLNLKIKVL